MTTAPLFAGIGGHHSARSRTYEWLTPPAIIEALGGPDSFDLDPASPIVRPWPTARAHYTIVDNGLVKPWFGRVWVNPPYGRTIGRWLARMAAHGRGVVLIFARTDTEAFHDHVWQAASGLLFIRGRLDFLRSDGRPLGNSGAPSVLCSYGGADLDVLAGCGIDGKLVPLQLPRSVVALALPATWRDEILAWLRDRRGPVALDELYRAFAGHPKSARNPNYQAKIRQVLQRGPFRRVARGQWCAA
jgi:hypothetical protein